MKLKVCGMKYIENIQQVADLQPNYLGFIFYSTSKRNFEGIIPELPKFIKKTGVFVNEYIEIVISLVEEYRLEAIQLHGDETVEYITELKAQLAERSILFLEENKQIKKRKKQHYISKNKLEIIKVFGVKNEFDFSVLKPYEKVVDYFLFDTKGKERGGNGEVFNWSLLAEYPLTKPYFLSGGIGVENVNDVLAFFQKKESKYCYALDVNSKFEVTPALKNIDKLKKFKQLLAIG